MRKFLVSTLLSLAIVCVAAPSPVLAEALSPLPRASIVPMGPSQTSYSNYNLGLNGTINAGGNGALSGQTVTILPIISNTLSEVDPDVSVEVIEELATEVTFPDANSSVDFNFGIAPLLFYGSNFIGLLVITETGDYGIAGVDDNNPDVLELDYSGGPLPVYRFWSPKFGNAHFFTSSTVEKEHLIANDSNWVYEGVGFRATQYNEDTGCYHQPVFRFYSGRYSTHFYTTSLIEKNHLIANDPNWSYEGIAYCANVSSDGTNTPLYRFWSPRFGKHFFTTNESEKNNLIQNDSNWIYEGVSYYTDHWGVG